MEHKEQEGSMLRKNALALAISAVVGSISLNAHADELAKNTVADEEAVEQIMVTGSRISRTTFDAPTPTVVISAEDIKISGLTNVNDILTSMPQFGEGLDSTSGNYSFGNSGLNVLNLRGIGATRTLVLVNGKRPTPITDDAQTMYADIGMIPSELLERVEVMTGGASAVYGSDAVAGVVNFILKKDYEGTSLRGQIGGTNDGGHDTRNFTLTHGFNFDDNRGNLSISVDYLDESALRQSDRKGSGPQQRSVANPRNTGAEDGIPDKVWLRDLTTTEWGGEATIFGIWNNDYNTLDWYDVNESTGGYSLRTPASNVYDGWLTNDGSGFPLDRWGMIEDPFERVNAYAALNYEFDSFDLSADITYSRAKSKDEIDPPFLNKWIQLGNDFTFDVPTGIEEKALTDDGGWTKLHYTFYEAGPRRHDNERDYLSANVTLSGLAFEDWAWDVNFSSGKSKTELSNRNALRTDRIDSQFAIIGPCQESNSCPSFSPFERPSQEVLDYVLDEHTSVTDVVSHAFSANIAGDLMELPAGALQMSAGLEVRYESLEYAPSELWQSGNLTSMQTPMDASRNIQEIYAEVLAPIVSDLPGIKALDVEAALRKAEYSTESSSFTSAKFGVNWTVNDSIRFRSTYSSAVRAPQLNELFSGQSIGYTTMTDPCHYTEIDGGPKDGRRVANCAKFGIEPGWSSNISTQRGQSITEGNSDLREEEAKTLTVGFIYQPTFVNNLRISLDFWDIKLEDMITSYSASGMMSNCVDLLPNSVDNDFCKQVSRDTNGDVLHVRPGSVNADESRRRGLDIEADYAIDNFTFKLVATRMYESSLTQFDFVDAVSVTDNDVGELGIPEWKSNFTTTYSQGDFSASWVFKFRETGRLNGDVSKEFRDSDTPGNSIMHDIRVSYDLTENANLYAGINNVTDHTGLDHWTTSYGTRNGWGILGRSYYAGFIYNF
ncbi:TonB-dependent receptor plug domain-containing protein [Thalassotalea atypica]|uniref:TonB-dependent receptor plug domain-containing protein n=1 Tax=Thalassotalea atypica TaxID=2054316 RepID=UPI002573E862|nr:TonB-dependent receptor [Thalassotalea atypica]